MDTRMSSCIYSIEISTHRHLHWFHSIINLKTTQNYSLASAVIDNQIVIYRKALQNHNRWTLILQLFPVCTAQLSRGKEKYLRCVFAVCKVQYFTKDPRREDQRFETPAIFNRGLKRINGECSELFDQVLRGIPAFAANFLQRRIGCRCNLRLVQFRLKF